MSRSQWFVAVCLIILLVSAMTAGFVWGAYASLAWVFGKPVAVTVFFAVFYIVAPFALLAYAIHAIAKRK